MKYWTEDRIDPELEREGLRAVEAIEPDDWYCYEDAGCWLGVVASNRE